MVKEARCMLILPLKRCRLSLHGKQYEGTEFHSLAIHGKKLLAIFVPQYLLQMFTSQKELNYAQELRNHVCMYVTYTK